MTAIPAIGIHNDLAPRQAGIPRRATHNKAASRVDIKFGVLVQPLGRDRCLDHMFHHVGANLFQRDIRAVLRGQHDRIHAHRDAVFVLHSNLRLPVRTQIGQLAALAHVAQLFGHLMRQGDRQGHELRCFVAGKAKHHPLVARADAVEGVGRAVLRLIGFIDAHGDVGRLHIDRCDNAAGIAVKSIFVVAIADVDGHIAGDRRNIHVAFRGNLTHDVQHPGCRRHLAGNMRMGVLLQNRIQYRVGNLVAEFIGMPLGHRFGSEKILCHVVFDLLFENCQSCPCPWKRLPPDSRFQVIKKPPGKPSGL